MVSKKQTKSICGMKNYVDLTTSHSLTNQISYASLQVTKAICWWQRVVIIERIKDQKTVHDGFYVELGRV
jgi:hypothetical protein